MTCPVDHEERRQMGLVACYQCGEELQTPAQANQVRADQGMSHFYGHDKVLRRLNLPPCPHCHGTGFAPAEAVAQE